MTAAGTANAPIRFRVVITHVLSIGWISCSEPARDAIPHSCLIIASRAVTMGDYWTAVWGIVYVSIFTLVIMYIASRLFATERVLTAKLKFRGLRKRGKTAVQDLE